MLAVPHGEGLSSAHSADEAEAEKVRSPSPTHSTGERDSSPSGPTPRHPTVQFGVHVLAACLREASLPPLERRLHDSRNCAVPYATPIM